MTAEDHNNHLEDRFQSLDERVEVVDFPDVDDAVDQDEEWCVVTIEGRRRRIRFHDYHEIYKVPGLYEEIFYRQLKCCSPQRVVDLLEDIFRDFEGAPDSFRVLDVGAGNGMVGEELRVRGVETVVGIDLIPEAREAAERDRPDTYDGYLVTDLTKMPAAHEERIEKKQLNCLVSVAALGFGDIPPQAFLKALSLIETPGWMGFNIKEDFLRESDQSGFDRLIRELAREEYIQLQGYRRYQHRLSLAGEPLYYVAMVAKKLREIPQELEEKWADEALA